MLYLKKYNLFLTFLCYTDICHFIIIINVVVFTPQDLLHKLVKQPLISRVHTKDGDSIFLKVLYFPIYILNEFLTCWIYV